MTDVVSCPPRRAPREWRRRGRPSCPRAPPRRRRRARRPVRHRPAAAASRRCRHRPARRVRRRGARSGRGPCTRTGRRPPRAPARAARDGAPSARPARVPRDRRRRILPHPCVPARRTGSRQAHRGRPARERSSTTRSGAHLGASRHRGDFPPHAFAGADEKRRHEVVGAEPCFPHLPPNGLGSAEAPQPMRGKAHGRPQPHAKPRGKHVGQPTPRPRRPARRRPTPIGQRRAVAGPRSRPRGGRSVTTGHPTRDRGPDAVRSTASRTRWPPDASSRARERMARGTGLHRQRPVGNWSGDEGTGAGERLAQCRLCQIASRPQHARTFECAGGATDGLGERTRPRRLRYGVGRQSVRGEPPRRRIADGRDPWKDAEPQRTLPFRTPARRVDGVRAGERDPVESRQRAKRTNERSRIVRRSDGDRGTAHRVESHILERTR